MFGAKDGYLQLRALDTTDPDAILEHEKLLSNKKTLFIVSTKSGGTVETLSFMKYFYNKTLEKFGAEETGKRFAAITDPGSGLRKNCKGIALQKNFLE